jgi:hypothetical protein
MAQLVVFYGVVAVLESYPLFFGQPMFIGLTMHHLGVKPEASGCVSYGVDTIRDPARNRPIGWVDISTAPPIFIGGIPGDIF